MDDGTKARLAALGVGVGARCLELGGGGGSIVRWLCRQVGDTGRVTAVDLDPRWLDELDEPNLTVVRHDLTAQDAPFAPQSFDFIHARAVLEHISSRDIVLKRICGWLAPGGWIYLNDCASFSIESTPNPVYAKAMRAWVEVLAKTGTDYEWGRALPLHLVRHGLQDVGAEVDVPLLRGGSPFAEFWSLTLEFLRSNIVEAGLSTHPDIDAARALLADPGFWDLSPAMVGAWGQWPAT